MIIVRKFLFSQDFRTEKKRNFEVKISAHPQAKCLWISGGVGGKGDKPK